MQSLLNLEFSHLEFPICAFAIGVTSDSGIRLRLQPCGCVGGAMAGSARRPRPMKGLPGRKGCTVPAADRADAGKLLCCPEAAKVLAASAGHGKSRRPRQSDHRLLVREAPGLAAVFRRVSTRSGTG